jgi:RNA-binding protein
LITGLLLAGWEMGDFLGCLGGRQRKLMPEKRRQAVFPIDQGGNGPRPFPENRAGGSIQCGRMSQKRLPARPRRSPVHRPGKAAAPDHAAAEETSRQRVPELSERQRRHLRGLAHGLKPIIRLGNAGLTVAVATETVRALHDHELIKIKAPGGDRTARDALFAELAQRTASALIHRIGNVAVLYRPHATLPRILLPDNS